MKFECAEFEGGVKFFYALFGQIWSKETKLSV